MKKILYDKINECIYKEKLDNGVEVYLYPTDKTKNFYITISVKYGGGTKEYSINGGKTYKNIIPGTAHFLEHKVMNFTGRKKLERRINELGIYANAYTSFEVTNYNFFGSNNIIESLKLLLDLFYNTKINDQNVEKEKGIITEEYKMYIDNPNFRINRQVMKNVLKNSYLNDILVGTEEEINKITAKELNNIYDLFYRTGNTFIIVTGNFNKEEVINTIKNYMKNIKKSPDKKIIYNKIKEPKKVLVPYMEIDENISTPKVIYTLKISKKDIPIKDKILKRFYLNYIFSSLFSNTSDIYDKYKESGLIINMDYSIVGSENNYLMNVSMITNNPDLLITELEKDLKNPKIDAKTFERKKKMFLNNLILNFENIEDIEYLITGNIIKANKIIKNSYQILENMSYIEMKKVLDSIDFNNYSILKVNSK